MVEILHACFHGFLKTANYSYKKFFSTPYQLARVHPLQRDRHADGRTTNTTTTRPLCKHGRLKI